MIELDEPTRSPLDELIEATEHKRQLEDQLAAVKKFIADVKPIVLQKWQEEGTTKISKNGNTAYIRSDFTVKPRISKEHVIEALMASGYDDLVTQAYNYKRLCSFVKECDDHNRELPPELLDAIETEEKFDIVVRKA